MKSLTNTNYKVEEFSTKSSLPITFQEKQKVKLFIYHECDTILLKLQEKNKRSFRSFLQSYKDEL